MIERGEVERMDKGVQSGKRNILQGQRHILDAKSSKFPAALRELPQAPRELFLIGDPGALQEGLAIIGARKASPYGISCAQRFASIAAEKGICIISGGALGCDSAAHRAAIQKDGTTLVFLGGGCDEIYPASNFALFQEIIDKGGAVASEYPWSQSPRKYMFRARNRLIAGLAKATLIVEAGLPSGTFSTADEALNANREVLVVPGAITSSFSRGSNRLLFQGATPVVDDESFESILFSLFGTLQHETFKNKLPGQLSDFSHLVFKILSARPCHLEELYSFVTETYKATDVHEQLMLSLVELEAKALVAKYPDGSYGPLLND